jgi:proline racemase
VEIWNGTCYRLEEWSISGVWIMDVKVLGGGLSPHCPEVEMGRITVQHLPSKCYQDPISTNEQGIGTCICDTSYMGVIVRVILVSRQL